MYFVLEKLEILNKSEGNCKWRLEAATLAGIVYLCDWGNFIFISWETILQMMFVAIMVDAIAQLIFCYLLCCHLL